jgi:uncharacterized protein YqeY
MINKIQTDITEAMKSKNATTLAVLRGLKTAITENTKLVGKNDISELEIINIIRKQIKQREDSMLAFAQANRIDLRDKEEAEVFVLQRYLPKELSESELENIIQRVIGSENATTKKDMGRVIKAVLLECAGRTDNKTISKRVSEILK